MSYLWIVFIKCPIYELSSIMNCPKIYEMFNLWNVLFMKYPVSEISCLWNVLSLKYPIYEMSFYEMPHHFFDLLLLLLPLSCFKRRKSKKLDSPDFFKSILMVFFIIRTDEDRNIFSINVELTSTFFTLQRFGPSPSPSF